MIKYHDLAKSTYLRNTWKAMVPWSTEDDKVRRTNIWKMLRRSDRDQGVERLFEEYP